MEYVTPSAFTGLSCSGPITNVPAAWGLSTRNVYRMRSFSIEGGGGAADGDIGAADREFPIGGAGSCFGVTEVGAPRGVPVPAIGKFPGTLRLETPVLRLVGELVSWNQPGGSSQDT